MKIVKVYKQINLKVDKEGGKSQKLLPKIKSKKFKFIPKLKNWNKIMNNFEENNFINKLRNKFDIDIFASYNNFFDNIPGPGYYSTRSYFDKYKIKSKDYKNNNFWSIQHNNISKKCKKELKKKSKPCLVVENFTKNKTSVPKKSKTKIALKDSMSTNNLLKKLFELNKNETFLKLNNTSTNYVNKLNLGPGQYNIKSQFEQINSKRYSFPLQILSKLAIAILSIYGLIFSSNGTKEKFLGLFEKVLLETTKINLST